ncbi:MAG: nucleotidyltransferase family protein [Anaerolineae bacterium]|nr:nucleotidyltransferase family protein [Anaerolineae bacterium]MDK1118596.1 nucleotidyltransferase family protein [Anaerolineae bacterium]
MVTEAHKTTNIILSALTPQQTPSKWESYFVGIDLNWDDLAIRAIVYGVAPLLNQQFTDWGYEVPSRAAAKLSANHKAHEIRNSKISKQLGEILELCKQKDLHPLALKGVHLASFYYKSPSLRPMNDIDLLFPPNEVDRAKLLFEEIGYGGKHKSPELGPGITKHTSTYRKQAPNAATPNPYLSTEGEVMIEPHISLEESWFGLKVDITPGIHHRGQLISLSGQPCLVLEPTDLLLHLCIHFSFHLIMGSPSIVQLVDLMTVTQKKETDWSVFMERAATYRAAPFALTGLSLAKKLLAAEVPDSILKKLWDNTPRSLASRIDGMGLSHILKRTQQKPLTNLRERIRRGFTDRAETAHWAPDIRSWLAVWQTMFTVWRTDTGRMLLKKKLH